MAGLVLAGCGGGSNGAAYNLAAAKSCAKKTLGVTLFPSIADDFVASTASGGAMRMHLADNDVTVLFGANDQEASNLADAYRRFHAKNVGIEDILRTDHNAVMLWQFHPSDADASAVSSCLK
jgi:hypothetical protein